MQVVAQALEMVMVQEKDEMAKILQVYLHYDRVGELIMDDNGQMVFEYSESWLNNPNAAPLSHSLPLQKERFSRNICRGFFG